MPILDIEAVLFDHETIHLDWVKEIAGAAGKIFETPPGRTCVRIRGLPRSHYAENSIVDTPKLCPVFVSVLKARLPEIEDLRVEVEKLTAAIAGIMERPVENVHVLYLPSGAGRISFGGKLVE